MGNYNFDEIINREDTDSLKYNWRERIFGKDDVLPLWVADMDFKTPDFCLDAIQKRLSHPILGYYDYPDSFYNSIKWWMSNRYNWEIETDWISFSPGIVPALSMCVMAFTNQGDKVLVQSPVYHPFYYSIENQKREIVKNPLKIVGDRYEMDFEDLENKLKQNVKLMFLCNPHNPVGRAWEKDILQRVGDLCIKYNCILVSDEIHSDLIMPGYKHTPIASISQEISMNTITLMAPSKTFNLAGLATAEVIIENKELRAGFRYVISDILHMFTGNIFGVVALEAAYSEKGIAWLDELLDYLKANVEFIKDFLKTHHSKIRVFEHQATYLAWLDFSEYKLSHKQLSDKLIFEAGVGLNDGAIFGEEGMNMMRINLALPKSQLKAALERLTILDN